MAAISVQVVLRPASGRRLGGHEPITAANLGEFQPDPAAAAAVERHFRERGFTVGPLVGNSFSLTGPPALFAREFGAAVKGDQPDHDRSLPLRHLPKEVAAHIEAVTQSEPLAFGPGNP
jgi:hypothetical protein